MAEHSPSSGERTGKSLNLALLTQVRSAGGYKTDTRSDLSDPKFKNANCLAEGPGTARQRR